MKEDFNIYGDVIIFDTTYRTNKYNLICAPIVGINNHWQTVMFGCAFIADEKIATFEWVLSTFKKSMVGSQPATIFTNQDLAMEKAIEKRSESTNNAVGFKANKNTSLSDFFRIFKQTVKRWRKKESDTDFQCSNSEPTSNFPMYGLLKHASETYTQTIFRYFESEFSYSMGCIAHLHGQLGDHYFYEVQIEDDISSRKKVTYVSSENRVACSCKNFEEVGWLCYHCIRILHQHSVTKILEHYILARWTKLAKSNVWKKKDDHEAENSTGIQKFKPWRHTMARKSYNLILKYQHHKETRSFIELQLKKIDKEADLIKRQLELQDAEKEEDEQSVEITKEQQNQEQIPRVNDPDRANTKGRSKRIKGHFEKEKQPKAKKTKAMQTKADTREFGTITPVINPKLF
ncbi:protein FAR1-RELATED SEQUENCE 5-like [Chenopodium quinoa]|uniref:protein FAR1-RELATED SEQUENCE 5-like n=1 Tax=Chenopodium quinoa TaxID=63459 RepID=UPI000B77B0A9|nr:protein FAR1-RELATED SEQUENCE 5-like [Chenopodium quinoa]